jgi:hypothetical protein
MKCPRCVHRIHRAADACPHCGFTLADADAIFGTEGVTVRALADQAGLLGHKGLHEVQHAIDLFDHRFPQLFLAVHTGNFQGPGNLRQFGFWLLNRATFEDLPASRTNEAGILIAIDAETKTAGMVFGYLLDAYLDEEDTFLCLARAHSYWLEGRYAEGLVRAIGQLEIILKKRCRQARFNLRKFARKVAPPQQHEELARKILNGRPLSVGGDQEAVP